MTTRPVIGVTGGIGSGKSTVSGILGSLGALVIDSDRIAHEELRSPEVARTLRSWWGPRVCLPGGGEVDRQAVADVVFTDPHQLKRLEDLLYPRIHRRRAEIMARHADDPDVRAFVVDAPKLFEAGVDRECDAVIFVDADEEVRATRVAKTRGWTVEELRRRENLQIPLDKKRSMSDHIVVNNHAGLDSLRTELQRILFSVTGACS